MSKQEQRGGRLFHMVKLTAESTDVVPRCRHANELCYGVFLKEFQDINFAVPRHGRGQSVRRIRR